jgi:hypothetical protein
MPLTIADRSQALHPPALMTIGHTKNRRWSSLSVIAVENNAVLAWVLPDHVTNCPHRQISPFNAGKLRPS